MSNMPIFSIRLKIMILIVGLLIGFGGALAFYVKTAFSERLTDELLKRGVSIARQLAENGSNAVIIDDRITLSRLAHSAEKSEKDIVYTFFVSAHKNRILAHSFGEQFPVDLLDANPGSSAGEAGIRKLLTSSGIVYDISTPVISREVGSVRLGISANSVTEAVNNLIRQMFTTGGIILLTAILIGLPIARAISNPISQLTLAVEKLSRREQSDPVRARSNDEIGQLAASFNTLAENLLQAEKKLASQIRFLETLLADLPEPVFYKNRNAEIIGCNHAFESFFGVRQANIIGQSSTGYRPQDEAVIHMARDKDVLENGKKVSYEMRIKIADVYRDIIFHKAPIREDSGVVSGLIGVMQDISEEREASRLKSEFVTTAAHEFQTPLASILGFSELLMEENSPARENLQDFIRLIYSKATFLSHLVDELLNLSRIESGRGIALQKSDCDVNNELGKIFASFRVLYPEHHFELTHPDETTILFVDKERMGQVVDNLLQNAVKYSKKGSIIRGSISRSTTHCIVSIADQGIGMSTEQLAHATEKFYRGDTSNTAPGGTGLGLFITRSIVEAHGGSMQIESRQEEGTTVTFQIPYDQPERELHTPRTALQVSQIDY